MVRRLAAGATSLDILGLDVTWTSEFAGAGWVVPWTGADEQQAKQDVLLMENGDAAFEPNWPYVYAAMQQDKPDLFKHFKWTTYPSVVPGQPAKVTIGGENLAISAYSPHKDEAFKAALCLRSPQMQEYSAVNDGVPPTIDPTATAGKMRQAIQDALDSKGVLP